MTEIKFQIGKAGITQGVIESLIFAFKNHKIIRISFLKSSRRDRDSIKDHAQHLISQLEQSTPYMFTATTIGFTIVLRRRAK